MSQLTPKIIVITPVKNEAWILDRFLAVTSQFADQIIIADQYSTDGSVQICKQHPKVTLIANQSQTFNEAERQVLLLNAARELVEGPKLILALDADEILAADAITSPGWQTMLQAKPGTIIFIEKVSIFGDTSQCVRYYPFPLGYMDDGAEHNPRFMHSTRIPTPDHATQLVLHDVKILHYLFMRPEAQRSKERLYTILEKLSGKSNLLRRRAGYGANRDYTQEGPVEASRLEWFERWEAMGIDLKSIIKSKHYWYDYEVLKYFKEHGATHFWTEDIWQFDWESFRQYALSQGFLETPDQPIKPPPKSLQIGLNYFVDIYKRLRHQWKR
jgi:glycosyltransferase involved in cell wall biosynthesis